MKNPAMGAAPTGTKQGQSNGMSGARKQAYSYAQGAYGSNVKGRVCSGRGFHTNRNSSNLPSPWPIIRQSKHIHKSNINGRVCFSLLVTPMKGD